MFYTKCPLNQIMLVELPFDTFEVILNNKNKDTAIVDWRYKTYTKYSKMLNKN